MGRFLQIGCSFQKIQIQIIFNIFMYSGVFCVFQTFSLSVWSGFFLCPDANVLLLISISLPSLAAVRPTIRSSSVMEMFWAAAGGRFQTDAGRRFGWNTIIFTSHDARADGDDSFYQDGRGEQRCRDAEQLAASPLKSDAGNTSSWRRRLNLVDTVCLFLELSLFITLTTQSVT